MPLPPFSKFFLYISFSLHTHNKYLGIFLYDTENTAMEHTGKTFAKAKKSFLLFSGELITIWESV
jgi:hypothetical protein